MTSISEDSANNQSLTEVIIQYFNTLLTALLQLLGLGPYPPAGVSQPSLIEHQTHVLPEFKASDFLTIVTDSLDWFAFDEFQVKLLKGFLLVFACNFFLICVAWNFYGQKISDKFMRPATSKAIQELQKSVSQLKLPSEHTPRI